MSVMVPINKPAKISEDIKRLSSPELADLAAKLTEDNMGSKLIAAIQAELQDKDYKEKVTNLGRASTEQGGSRDNKSTSSYKADRDPFNE